jgi:hypothetical protein
MCSIAEMRVPVGGNRAGDMSATRFGVFASTVEVAKMNRNYTRGLHFAGFDAILFYDERRRFKPVRLKPVRLKPAGSSPSVSSPLRRRNF